MKINKREYEDLVRDSERMAILTGLRQKDIYISDDILDVLCGLQTSNVSDIKATEQVIMNESEEDVNKKARLNSIAKFMDEEQDEPENRGRRKTKCRIKLKNYYFRQEDVA